MDRQKKKIFWPAPKKVCPSLHYTDDIANID